MLQVKEIDEMELLDTKIDDSIINEIVKTLESLVFILKIFN